MFVASLTDIFNTYIERKDMNIGVVAEALRSYVNKELYKISKKYNNKTPAALVSLQ